MTTDALATPSRIAMAGDWYANTRWATHTIRHIADMGGRADVILHLGDFGYGPVYVTGLDCDATSLDANVQFVELFDYLRQPHRERR